MYEKAKEITLNKKQPIKENDKASSLKQNSSTVMSAAFHNIHAKKVQTAMPTKIIEEKTTKFIYRF